MAYDEAGNVAILFGGRGEGGRSLGDTWSWNGAYWKLVSTGGPTPRAFHAMAYDQARRVVVLFGGRDSTHKPLGDTWEWDGDRWQLVSTAGPPARDHHAAEYDPHRRRTIVFGGDSVGSYLADTWGWDGTRWSLLSRTGPSARAAHHLLFDPGRRRTVLFGGRKQPDAATTLGDTWEWDGSRWERLTAIESEGRSHFAMTHVLECGCVIRFGGGDSERVPVGDTWQLTAGDGGWTRIASAGPDARVDMAMVYDRLLRRAILFGGYVPGAGGTVFADTWVWNGKAWELLGRER